MTYSSSQIEGKCLESFSEPHHEGKSFPGVFSGLHHFSTHEELPQVFSPVKESHPSGITYF